MRLGKVFPRVGSVAVVVGLAAAVAGLLHHFSSLPSAYTWWFTLEIFRDTLLEPFFPTAALVAWYLGARVAGPTEDLGAGRPSEPLCVLAGALTTITVARTMPSTSAWDHAAMGAAVTIGLRNAARWRNTAVMAAELAWGLALYVLASYAHTVAKALVSVHPMADVQLIAMETAVFGAPLHRAATQWSAGHPGVVRAASYVYRWFTAEFLLVTTLLAAARRHRERVELLAALCFALVLGAPLYHILPTRGPYFSEPDFYAHLRRMDIVTDWYAWLESHSNDVQLGVGTEVRSFTYLAAMPSLHVGMTAICTWYTRTSRIAFAVAVPHLLLMWFTTMILGWHYFSDGLAGIAIAVVCIVGARRSRWLVPEWLSAGR